MLHIEDYHRHRDTGLISVYGRRNAGDFEIQISEDQFHGWLANTDRLLGTMDYYDAGEPDRHGQVSYTLDPEEYWDISTERDICKDIEFFILRHDIFGDSFDMFGALGAILKDQHNRTL
jgi:hypothetical protein